MDYTAFAHRYALGIIVFALIAAPLAVVMLWRGVLRALETRGRCAVLACAAAIGAAVFIAMARRLVQGDAFASADQRLLDAVRGGVPASVAQAFALLTHLGDPWCLTLVCALCCAALIFARRVGLAVYLALVTSAGGMISHALKLSMRRTRPADALVPLPESFSFPSGHTFGAMVCFGMCAYALMRIAPRRHESLIVALACFLVVLVGVSRVVIGVHFPGDVVGGLAAGGAWLAVCVGVGEVARRRKS
jgi:membrane-associated phospholipid phosphatase